MKWIQEARSYCHIFKHFFTFKRFKKFASNITLIIHKILLSSLHIAYHSQNVWCFIGSQLGNLNSRVRDFQPSIFHFLSSKFFFFELDCLLVISKLTWIIRRNTVSGVTNTVGGVVGAVGRGVGETVNGITGNAGKPIGDGIKDVGEGIEGGAARVAKGVKDAGEGVMK